VPHIRVPFAAAQLRCIRHGSLREHSKVDMRISLLSPCTFLRGLAKGNPNVQDEDIFNMQPPQYRSFNDYLGGQVCLSVWGGPESLGIFVSSP
jgi:hypothetical protein